MARLPSLLLCLLCSCGLDWEDVTPDTFELHAAQTYFDSGSVFDSERHGFPTFSTDGDEQMVGVTLGWFLGPDRKPNPETVAMLERIEHAMLERHDPVVVNTGDKTESGIKGEDIRGIVDTVADSPLLICAIVFAVFAFAVVVVLLRGKLLALVQMATRRRKGGRKS